MEPVYQKRKIGIIGSGISGLSAAWLLRSSADVTLYESDSRFGGHTHTYEIQEADRMVQVDTGFMVYNQRNYPNLVELFRHLGVQGYPNLEEAQYRKYQCVLDRLDAKPALNL